MAYWWAIVNAVMNKPVSKNAEFVEQRNDYWRLEDSAHGVSLL
jgi:hypothetical protein